MKRAAAVLFVMATLAHAETPACVADAAEREVRDAIGTVIDMRARQDERFVGFYDAEEYSFPGETWVFRGQDRAAERGRAIESARAAGNTWKMEIRELRVKAGCDMAWVACFVHAERLDAERKTTHTADWRLTAVLERRAAGWRIVHQHSSLPIHDQRQWWKRVGSPD
jgi:ketosteroid isomerase-like protein